MIFVVACGLTSNIKVSFKIAMNNCTKRKQRELNKPKSSLKVTLEIKVELSLERLELFCFQNLALTAFCNNRLECNKYYEKFKNIRKNSLKNNLKVSFVKLFFAKNWLPKT